MPDARQRAASAPAKRGKARAGEKRSWQVTDSLAVAALPAVVFTLSYAYEGGFALAFRIPFALIAPNWNTVVIAVAILLGCSVFVAGAVRLDALLRRWLSKLQPADKRYEWPVVRAVMAQMAPVVLPLYPFLLFVPPAHQRVVSITGMVVAFSILLFRQLGRRRHSLHDEAPRLLQDDAPIGIWRWITDWQRPAAMAKVALYAVGVALALGYHYGVSCPTFHVIKQPQEVVVLRIYGDRLICTQFDRQTKTVSGTFVILSVGSGTTMVREDVGPLHQ